VIVTLEFIDKLIEREQALIDEAFKERTIESIDKHKWHRAMKRAFVEVKKHIEEG
jgi:hypothetical protein